MPSLPRRGFLRLAAAAIAPGPLAACAAALTKSAKVVVVGGGYGGATAAKYLRMWSEGRIEVTLVEPASAFVSCPLSNLVLGGSRSMAGITVSYDALAKHHGVKIAHDHAVRVDADGRQVHLAGGAQLPYDRLVLSPGIDFMWEELPGMASAAARASVLHAWKAGPQTVALRQQLAAMPDGGVFALAIPLAPYRCPPAPYERACQVAHYFHTVKPRSKVLVFDANADVTSKGELFKKAWVDRYPGIIEYRPSHALVDVDAAAKTLKFEFNDDASAQVLNVVPPMRAGNIAVQAGLATANGRWCEVDWLTHESVAARNIHVLGDAVQVAPAMPKSGHMANQHGKTCAAAVIALLAGREPNPQPLYNNTCYSFVSDEAAVHVASVHRYDAREKTMLPVHGAGGLSEFASDLEGGMAKAWARAIWADSLG